MISLETRINGKLIGFASIINTEIPVEGEEGYFLYHVEYHRVEREPAVLKYSVVHRREDEADVLAELVYEGLQDALKKIRK